MYQPLPSTLGSALATIGKKAERSMSKDLRLVRESDSRIVVKYGQLDIGAYNAPSDGFPLGSVEVAPDEARSSGVLSALNQMLAGTGAVIGAESKAQAQKFRESAMMRGIDVSKFPDAGGWILFAPAKVAESFCEPVELPIL